MSRKYHQRCRARPRTTSASNDHSGEVVESNTASAATRSVGSTVRASHTASGTSCGGGDSARQTLYWQKRLSRRSGNGFACTTKTAAVASLTSTWTNRAGCELSYCPHSGERSAKRRTPRGTTVTEIGRAHV